MVQDGASRGRTHQQWMGRVMPIVLLWREQEPKGFGGWKGPAARGDGALWCV